MKHSKFYTEFIFSVIRIRLYRTFEILVKIKTYFREFFSKCCKELFTRGAVKGSLREDTQPGPSAALHHTIRYFHKEAIVRLLLTIKTCYKQKNF